MVFRVKINRFIPLISALSIVIFITISSYYSTIKVIYNYTNSLPKGFYYITKSESYRVGDLVAFSIPSHINEYIDSSNLLPIDALLMKTIVGSSGDYYCTISGEFIVNNESFGGILSHDSNGNRLPNSDKCGVIPYGHFVVGSFDKHNFDSRYFGAISEDSIAGISQSFIEY